jgi:hypothetical protein
LVFPFLGLYIFLALSSEIFFVSVLVSDWLFLSIILIELRGDI